MPDPDKEYYIDVTEHERLRNWDLGCSKIHREWLMKFQHR